MAVLSAFQWDSQWILEKFRLPGTLFVLVMQAKGEDEVCSPPSPTPTHTYTTHYTKHFKFGRVRY